MTQKLKDDVLDDLAEEYNVAAFFSVRRGSKAIEYQRLPHGENVADITRAAHSLLRWSRSGTVNVRTFSENRSKGLPFTYGIETVEDVQVLIERYASQGLHCLVNETIDVHDGGVSGVSIGDLVEFVPDDTPRGVEKVDSASMCHKHATAMLQSVYGAGTHIPRTSGERIEFSLHPSGVGVRSEQLIVWEREEVSGFIAPPANLWPNRFSRHIGDKTYGLLVADAAGYRVPRTLAISRRVRPYEFGTSTGSTEIWTRTAPGDQAQGKYTTVRGWTDVFDLLAREDATHGVAAVLRQDEVSAVFAGAAMSRKGGVLVEGVSGFGDRFMLGSDAPETLPESVVDLVARTVQDLESTLKMDVSIEWAIGEDDQVWVLQLHVFDRGENDVLVDGKVDSWIDFAPSDGVEKLRRVLDSIESRGVGVRLTEPVGRTSHIGDLLRATATPARFDSQ